MAHDVFISYSSNDKTVADAACGVLEARGIRCWIAPRDVRPGQPYGEAIVDGIGDARVMVLVFSSHANTSTHVAKEVERAVSKGLTIIPLRIEDVMPAKSLDYFIGSVHWLDAMTPPLGQHLEKLAADIAHILPDRGAVPPPVVREPAPVVRDPAPPPAPPVVPPRSHAHYLIAAALIVAGAIVGYALWRPAPEGAAPAGQGGVDLSGCWNWFNGATVRFDRDGTASAPPFTGKWKQGGSGDAVLITWPPPVDTVTLSGDGRTLAGGNQYGVAVAGMRLSGRGGLEGSWKWGNGVTATFQADGSGSAGPFAARWSPAGGRTYKITWPPPVDSLTLSPRGDRLDGANQYGVAISGVRLGRCP